ncbi:MAG: aminotransferase class IV, partial [Chitinophagaceae bacterium]
MSRTAYFNGEFMQEENVRLHISDLSIQRGYGVFDFFRTINHQPFFMNDYLERFFNSAKGLHLDPGISKEKLQSVIHELINRNQLPQSGFRLTLTGGYSPDSYLPALPNFIITHQPLSPRPAAMVEDGLKLITHEYIRESPELKSISYLTAVRIQPMIRAVGATDSLYHWKGVISELPRSNFFIVTRDETIVTASENILRGITRKKTLELAGKHFKAEERTITIDDVREAKEAFATSTTKQI